MRFVAASLGLTAMAACSTSGSAESDVVTKDAELKLEDAFKRGVLVEPLEVAAYCRSVGRWKVGLHTFDSTLSDTAGTKILQASDEDQSIDADAYYRLGGQIMYCPPPREARYNEIRSRFGNGYEAPQHHVRRMVYDDCDLNDGFRYKTEHVPKLEKQCFSVLDSINDREYPVTVAEVFPLD